MLVRLILPRLRLPTLIRLSSSSAPSSSSSSPSSSSVPAPATAPNAPTLPPVPASISPSVSDGIAPLGAVALPDTTKQSPNAPTIWSPSQTPRNVAYGNARFEQTHLEYQPQPQSAMAMIANEPIILVQGRKAVCDGGGGALGHPKVFINLDQPGARSCGYCGTRFEQDHEHHHVH